MAFRRDVQPGHAPAREALDAAMIGLGMRFVGRAEPHADVERTLVFASVEGVEREDFRVLAVLCTWLDVHLAFVNADRLFRMLEPLDAPRTRAFWSAIGRWKGGGDPRFARFERLHRGPRIDLFAGDPQVTAYQVARGGEDRRFEGSALRVPAGVLRDRRADVLEPAELARRHPVYRWRVIIGPTYRADAWAELSRDPTSSAAELARQIGSSFGAAREARLHFRLAMGEPPPPETRAAAARHPRRTSPKP